MRRFVASLALALALPTAALAAEPVVVENVSFERSLYLQGHKVWLNGAGPGNFASAKAYVAALYLVKPAKQLSEAQASPGPKRLQLTLLGDMDSKQLGNLLSQTLQANMPATELAACLPGLAQLGQVLGAKKKLANGDQLVLDSMMTQGTHLFVNGNKLALIEGPVFFDCILKGYLGSAPSDAALRIALLKPVARQ